MDRNEAEKVIKALFTKYKSQITTTDEQVLAGLSDGKLYELYVLAEVVDDLTRRGCKLTFQGVSLKFKGGPGMLKTSDPHFTVRTPNGDDLWLFVDIEFDTLGRDHTKATDRSRRHELDIVLVTKGAGYPTYQEIWFGVECKAVANFGKGLVKEALGVRRELSLLNGSQPSLLSLAGGHPPVAVPAAPASEFWLAHIDWNGTQYTQSPLAFGVHFRHFEP